MDALLTDLIDKQAITEQLYRYCRAVDRADRELLLSCYHPDAIDDHGKFRGTPKEFLAHLEKRTLNPAVGPLQHSLTNILIEIRGDIGYAESYFQSRFVTDGKELVMSVGRYVDRFERRSAEWKIAHRKVILEYARTGFDTSDFVSGARDRDDPSYLRTWE